MKKRLILSLVVIASLLVIFKIGMKIKGKTTSFYYESLEIILRDKISRKPIAGALLIAKWEAMKISPLALGGAGYEIIGKMELISDESGRVFLPEQKFFLHNLIFDDLVITVRHPLYEAFGTGVYDNDHANPKRFHYEIMFENVPDLLKHGKDHLEVASSTSVTITILPLIRKYRDSKCFARKVKNGFEQKCEGVGDELLHDLSEASNYFRLIRENNLLAVTHQQIPDERTCEGIWERIKKKVYRGSEFVPFT
jgi:hypothetical protein